MGMEEQIQNLRDDMKEIKDAINEVISDFLNHNSD